jgi:rhamnose transport system ATP-binding protein
MRNNAREVLDTMHAEPYRRRCAAEGPLIANKHLVGVARAHVDRRTIVIMDEPTAALSTKEIEELFRSSRF